MSTTHTPGPWKLVKTERHPLNENEQISFIQLKNKPCLDVSTVENETYTREEHEANARLIAAAPELLEALILVQSKVGNLGAFWMHEVNAAIKKATAN